MVTPTRPMVSEMRAHYKRRDQGEGNAHERARHRLLVRAEPPPHELPLRGHEDALLVHIGHARAGQGRTGGTEGHLGRGHHVSSSRMRGSTHTSRMSETRVP